MADNENKDIDALSGVETTGHTWDGIQELNNPLPRWWLWTFYATIAFSVVYMIIYPAWPGITEASKGLLGWSSRAAFQQEMDAASQMQADRLTQIASLDMAGILANDDLRTFAVAGGQSAYKIYCVQCHGAGAAGGPGYPNLNDDAWIWGGTVEDIQMTLAHGIRYESDDNTRFSMMPAFGQDGILAREEISDVAWYVRQLSDQEADAEAAARGMTIYTENCEACHGASGEGIRELGGPRLNDAIWLYGGSHAEIVQQVIAPKHGVMPGWQERLGETVVKQLTAYVHSLGGGE